MSRRKSVRSQLAALVFAVFSSSASSANSVVDRLGGLDVPEMKRTLATIFKGATSEVPDDDPHRIFVYTILGGIFRVCGGEGGMFAYAARRYVEPALSGRGFTGSLEKEILDMSEPDVRLSADRLGNLCWRGYRALVWMWTLTGFTRLKILSGGFSVMLLGSGPRNK